MGITALLVADVDITNQLIQRRAPAPDYLGETRAIQDLAGRMADIPDEVLPRLTGLALEMCEAASAGISVLEGDSFLWMSLVGKLAVFEGTTAPLHNSPCGVCLERLAPTLMERPERVYRWIADAGVDVPEVLLIPLRFNDGAPIGTIWVVAHEGQHFHAGHARVMTELALFAGSALKVIRSAAALKEALAKEETFAREMSHRVKNFFSVANGLVRMTARHSPTKEHMVENLLHRLNALADAHALAQGHRAETDHQPVLLTAIIETVLRPYCEPAATGPVVHLTPDATSNFTLVLHELATNAAKHGALRTPSGSIALTWRVTEDGLELDWIERTGSLTIRAPERMGFGTTLLRNLIAAMGGSIDKVWAANGLEVRITLPSTCLAA